MLTLQIKESIHLCTGIVFVYYENGKTQFINELENLGQNNASLNTIWLLMNIIHSCVYIFQSLIKSFIDVLNCLKKT